jgi:regulator of protease activity HflC (stomatin/prohibitin superfamily)
MNMNAFLIGVAVFIVLFFFLGIRIIRPNHRGLVEVLGKYSRVAPPGLHWIFPMVARMFQIDTAEQMVDAEPQNISTSDNLNARLDAQVYFRVLPDELSVKASRYNVNDYKLRIVDLARATLRDIIGAMTFKSATSERSKINTELLHTILDGTKNWGIAVVRTELEEAGSSRFSGQ